MQNTEIMRRYIHREVVTSLVISGKTATIAMFEATGSFTFAVPTAIVNWGIYISSPSSGSFSLSGYTGNHVTNITFTNDGTICHRPASLGDEGPGCV